MSAQTMTPPEPFTYWQGKVKGVPTGYLVADVESEAISSKPSVVLIPFDGTRHNPKRIAITDFCQLVAEGKLKPFTPKV